MNGFTDGKGQFRPTGKDTLNGKKFSAFDFKAKENVVIINPQKTTLKNGAPAVKGVSSATGLKVHRILSKSEAKELNFK